MRRYLLPSIPRILHWILSIGLGFLVGCSAGPSERPNLLLISIDTLRADHLGVYGRAEARTPVLDALARRGRFFEQAFTSVPVTLPAHTTLLTGLLPPRHGVRNNSFDQLDSSHETLATVLQRSGYQTAAILGAAVLDRRFGLKAGFETYDDQIGNPDSALLIAERSADEVANRALDWLSSQPESPFFLWLHFFDPHDPYRAPPGTPGDTGYDREIAFVDGQIGGILKELGDSGRLEDTLVAVVSDHGEGLGEHGEETHGIFLYDSTLRVPMILAGPRVQGDWHIPSFPVGLVDLMPTLLSLLGLPVPEGLDGLDLTRSDLAERPFLYAETFLPRDFYHWSELRALRGENEKFISAPRPEYYRLDRDSGEEDNLFSSETQRARTLASILERDHARGSRNSVGEVDPELLKRIQGLGYVGSSAVNIASEESLPDPKDKVHLVSLMDEALAAGRNGKSHEAVRILESILSQDPTNFLAWHNLADRYFELKQPARALDAYQKALELGPDRAYYFYRKALCLEQLRRFSEAADAFKQLLLRDSSAGQEILQRADVLAEEDQFAAATSYLDALEEVDFAGPAVTTRRLRILMAQEKWSEALPLTEKVLQEAPGDESLRRARAEVLQNLASSRGEAGELEESVRLFQEASRLDPGRFDILANLGLTYLRQGDQKAALEVLEQALRIDPDQTRILNLVGEIYFREGNPDSAIRSLRRSLQINPDQPQVRQLLDRISG